MFFEETYTVDSRDADTQGLCRPSALFGYLQEAATRAAGEFHVSREEVVARYNAIWMLARIWCRLDVPVYWNDAITVRTWHRGGKGASMYRDFDLYRGGVHIGEAVSVWVLADVDSRRLFRISKAPEFEGTDGGALCKDRPLAKLRVPADLAPAGERALHYSDADMNGHVNNVRYADFVCDALHVETLGTGQFVSELQLGYLAECLPGETIQMSAGMAEGRYYVEGSGPEGGKRFDGMVLLRPIRP